VIAASVLQLRPRLSVRLWGCSVHWRGAALGWLASSSLSPELAQQPAPALHPPRAASQHDHASLDVQQRATLAQRDTLSGLVSSYEGVARLGGWRCGEAARESLLSISPCRTSSMDGATGGRVAVRPSWLGGSCWF